jgi:hypothetical protein
VFIGFMFDPGRMARDRLRPDCDRLLVARISGIAKRHAQWRAPTEAEIAAAVAELREVAGDRPDLLAEGLDPQFGSARSSAAPPRSRKKSSPAAWVYSLARLST